MDGVTQSWRFGDVTAPDGVSGDWRVETFEITQADAEMSRIRAMWRPSERVLAGTFKRLMCGREVVMSNTQMEINSNWPIVHAARGDVLVNGLGLGMVLEAIIRKPGVNRVVVVEKNEDVIKLVAPRDGAIA
jgi:hypothetical protein